MLVGGVTKPVYITPEAWFKMLAYSRVEKDLECQGLAAIEEDDDKIVIVMPKLVKQVVGAAACDSEADFTQSFIDLSIAHPDAVFGCYWHTHASFETHFSATDKTQIQDFLDAGCEKLLSICINTKGDSSLRMDYRFPRVWFTDLKWGFLHADISMAELEAAAKVEHDEKVTVKKAKRGNRGGRVRSPGGVFYDPLDPVGVDFVDDWDDDDRPIIPASAAQSYFSDTCFNLSMKYLTLFDPISISRLVINKTGMSIEELRHSIRTSGLAKRFKQHLQRDLTKHGASLFKSGLLLAASKARGDQRVKGEEHVN